MEQTLIVLASYIISKKETIILSLNFHGSHLQLSFAEVLHPAGLIPLPPYIKREVEEKDAERYQTIYAITDGSVAAPTAGLHFTDHIFKTFTDKKYSVGFCHLTCGCRYISTGKS